MASRTNLLARPVGSGDGRGNLMGSDLSSGPPAWKVVLAGAAAGGLGWGIRGQYGHETGAMIAGLLVSLSLALLLCPQGPSLQVARAVAWGTLAMGFGGSMTYGQTIGLTQNPGMIGRWDALAWGFLGLAIKGGLWIAFAGALLGMGLGGRRYRGPEVLGILVGMMVLCWFGIWALNEPYDPARRILPRIYFSADWRWDPDASLKPRREVWGGYLFALVGLLSYLGFVRRDPLAVRLAAWGLVGGAVGFPLGQSVQAFHAWNPELFRSGFGSHLEPVMNWWNWMETLFGMTLGGALALGLYWNRDRIRFTDGVEVLGKPPGWEWAALGVHTTLLVSCELLDLRWATQVYDFGLVLGALPILAVALGLRWPAWVMLPLTVLTIGGKTFRAMVGDATGADLWVFLLVYAVLPLGFCFLLARQVIRDCQTSKPAQCWLKSVLLLNVGLYFGLNFAFFQFPWPWLPWTARTPNALFFLVAAALLVWIGIGDGRGKTLADEEGASSTGGA